MIYKPNDVMFIEIFVVDAITKRIYSDLTKENDLGELRIPS